MLDTHGSSWAWADAGAVGADGRRHFSSARETLASGCFRIFRTADVVLTTREEEIEDTAPGRVDLGQVVDFFEDPRGEREHFGHMVVVFRWLYHQRDADEAALIRRDLPEDGEARLSASDFFLSGHVEDERNGVEALIGKALLCPALRQISEYEERLRSGRQSTRAALAAHDSSAELGFTESDGVFLCRWFYARDPEEGEGTEIPEGGRLVALTEEALRYFLARPSARPGFVYSRMYHRFMRDGVRTALLAEEPAVVRKRFKLGAARRRRQSETSNGGALAKRVRVAEVAPEAGRENCPVEESNQDRWDEVASAVIVLGADDDPWGKNPKKTVGDSKEISAGEVPDIISGKSCFGKELIGRSKTVSVPFLQRDA